MAFTDPISTTATPYTTSGTAHSLVPSTYFTYTGSKVMPTNAWWQNILIPYYDTSTYNGKTHTIPYAQWPSASGKGYSITYFGNGTDDRSVADKSITLSSNKDVTLEIAEAITSRQVTDYSDLGVNLKFNSASGYMATSFVQGQAFNSATYSAATPVITMEQSVLLINGVSPSSATLSNVTKLKVQMNRDNRYWLIYASAPISFTLNGNILTATSTYTGTIQVATLGDNSNEAIYDASYTSIVTGGSVNSTFSGNTAAMTFSFSSTGSGSPLIFALPHHQDLMPSVTYSGVTLPSSLKGTLKAIKSNTWTMNETLTSITWRTPNAIPSSKYADIQAALSIEKNSTYDMVGGGYGWSPYYGGKYIAKMARLILIAEEIGDTSSATSIATSLKAQVATYLQSNPTGTEGQSGSGYFNALIYQGGSTWKGIATQNGLADMGADFGSGRFNDHHFHYGYWIYTAAVLARNDSAWLNSIKPYIEALIRDIANPSYTDTYFPKYRHKDWFNGHSYADGLVGSDVGPGQESTSEAINAWYGIHLWGLATANTDMSNMGRLLLASEIRSAKRYWHIYDNSDIYPATYSNNGNAVIVRTHKTAVETYFGTLPHYFLGIQALPYTPITEEYMDSAWIQRSYATASSQIPATVTSNPQDTAWDSVIWSAHAVIDPSDAYVEAQNLTLEQIPEYTTSVQYGREIDNGHTKANALAWASTRSTANIVGATTTSTTLTSSPSGSLTQGTSVTFTATVSPTAATGSVSFQDNSGSIGTATVSNGIATLTNSLLASGAHSVTATFSSSNTATYTNSTSAPLSITITSSSVSSGSGGSTASASKYLSLSYGQPTTAVRTPVNDANYSVVGTDSIIGVTALTASRTITLPVIASVPAGMQLVVKDESGQCSGTLQIVVAGTIDNTPNATITVPYGKLTVYAGVNSWFSIKN